MKLSREIIETLAYTTNRLPFISDYLLQRMEIVEDPGTDTAKTNGEQVIFGPWVNTLPLAQRVFVCSHEVLHGIFQHPEMMRAYIARGRGPKGLPWDREVFHLAADLIVNRHLVADKIGEAPGVIVYDPDLDPKISLEDLYERLLNEKQGGSGRAKDGQGGSGQPENGEPSSGSSPHGKPLDELQEAPTGRKVGDPDQREAVEHAAAVAKARGNLPGSLAHLAKPEGEARVPWEEELRDYVQLIWEPQDTTYERINRRRLVLPPHIPLPAVAGHALRELVIAIDTSGSISAKECQAFVNEVAEIYEETSPETCYVLAWDTVAHPIEIADADDLRDLELPGGGGTDYHCVPPMIEDLGLDPDVVICLTDGMARVPDGVPWEHITVTTSKYTFPFGRNIQMVL